MKGILKKVALKECEIKNGDNKGRKFKVLDYEVDVTVNEEKGEIKTRRGSMSEEYAKKYFAYCGRKTKECIGQEVEVVLSKRKYEKDDEVRTVEYIKFLNLLDENGKPIIMERDENKIEF